MTGKTIFYKKEGRKYVPVYEYDQELMDALPKGDHLVSVYPGGSNRRYNIDPNYAAMIAAGRVAEDVICEELRKASDLRPRNKPITPEQLAAWQHLVEVFGPEAELLEWPSAREATERAVKAMQAEAEKLMQHPSVKKAYEHFQLVCNLVSETEVKGVK
jgi:hypothetical protein